MVQIMALEEADNLNIAVLSGKGGTGKTTISTNLALALNANYIDCDVEEPNGFLFLNPQITDREQVMVDYPVIDMDKCTYCGRCADICQFNAFAKVNNDIMLFQKICHGCGACEIVCEAGALKYNKREIGIIEVGYAYDIKCIRGILNIGEPMAVPVIRQIIKTLPDGLNIIDCPPGTSCNVVSSIKEVQGAILVTEPTEFGFHDLKMALELVKKFNIPFGIVINRDDGQDNMVKQYCNRNKIDIIGTVPYSKDIARLYSKGDVLYYNPKYRQIFDALSEQARGVLKWN